MNSMLSMSLCLLILEMQRREKDCFHFCLRVLLHRRVLARSLITRLRSDNRLLRGGVRL